MNFMFFVFLDNIGGKKCSIFFFFLAKLRCMPTKISKIQIPWQARKIQLQFSLFMSVKIGLFRRNKSRTSETHSSSSFNNIYSQTLFHHIKVISLATVSECISGYQPTETKMASVINTINTIGNTKSQQGMKAIQQTWNWPCIGPKQKESLFI